MANKHCVDVPSPSSLARTAVCPGWFLGHKRMGDNMKQIVDKIPKTFADEGTEKHACYESAIYALLGRSIEEAVSDVEKEYGNKKWWSFDFKRELAEYLSILLTDMREIHGQLRSEVTSDCSEYVDGLYGTADAVVSNDTEIHVYDIKTGMRKVEVQDNLQLVCYAAGFITPTTKRVAISIWQFGKLYTAIYSTEEIKQKMLEIKAIIEESKKDDAKRVASEHCSYCPLATTCATARKRMYGLLGEVMEQKDQLDLMSMSEYEDFYDVVTEAKSLIEAVYNNMSGALKNNEENLQKHFLYRTQGQRKIINVPKLVEWLTYQFVSVSIEELYAMPVLSVGALEKKYGKDLIGAVPEDIIQRGADKITVKKKSG